MNATTELAASTSATQGSRLTSVVVLFVVLVAGLGYIALNVDSSRVAGLGPVLAEYAVWVALLGVALYRSPGLMLRLSDPYLALLGLGFNFLLYPGVLWLHGSQIEEHWFEVGRIRMDIFIQLQWLHIMYMVSLSAAYFAIAPRLRFVPVGLDRTAAMPSSAPWIIAGLTPIVIDLVKRVITTGTLAATQNYGDVWADNYAQVTATHVEGGSALVAAQFIGKVWFLPWLALGIGEGLLLARLLRERRTVPLMLFVLQAPVLLFLNSGGRSIIAAPFLIAVMVADVLAGPIRWRWALSIGGLAMVGLNFFGFYRAYRDRDFGEAISIANEQFRGVANSESLSVESGIMLIKEHYAVAWTDANNYARGISYFSESILSLLPQQIVPEKLRFMNTSNFLSRELLGRDADAGAGVAGAIIADGYMIGRELGVIVLGGVLGGMAGAITRMLGRGSRAASHQPALWQVVLLVSWSLQSIPFFRNDIAIIISQLFSVLALPALFFALWIGLSPKSPWARRVPTAS